MRRWGHEVTEHLLTGIWSIHSPCPDFVFLRSSYLVIYVFLVYWLLGCCVPEDYDLQEGRDFVSFVDC